jgi:hypothetical protein
MTLDIRGVTAGLLDEPFNLHASGAAPGDELLWRARYRDDDLRVWRAAAGTAPELSGAWKPAKASTGPLAALGSLRPLQIDVRLESRTDGRAASRTLTRPILGEGVRVRRWRDLDASLHLPAGEPCATLVVAGELHPAAAPLLASRGALVLVAAGESGAALERLAAVPEAAEPIALQGADVPPPPNVGASGLDPQWDALLARLGARPRAAS